MQNPSPDYNFAWYCWRTYINFFSIFFFFIFPSNAIVMTDETGRISAGDRGYLALTVECRRTYLFDVLTDHRRILKCTIMRRVITLITRIIDTSPNDYFDSRLVRRTDKVFLQSSRSILPSTMMKHSINCRCNRLYSYPRIYLPPGKNLDSGGVKIS